MESSERIERLIETKSWSELSVDEKAFVIDTLGSAEQYHAMRDVHFSMLDAKKIAIQPDHQILENLRDRFREKHAMPYSWNPLRYKVSTAIAVACILAAAFAGWVIAKLSIEPVMVTHVVEKRDTLFMASKPDTLFVDRVKYKTIVKEILVTVAIAGTDKGAEGRGVNMKETEALETLLVSGSE